MILTLSMLIGAAILEVGGDALIRFGLNGARGWIFAGAASLTFYGVVVNQGALDFGRLMGAYIAIFFVVSQVIAVAFFHQAPSRSTLAGGSLIVAGGLLMML